VTQALRLSALQRIRLDVQPEGAHGACRESAAMDQRQIIFANNDHLSDW
jgi:hypothetical protein